MDECRRLSGSESLLEIAAQFHRGGRDRRMGSESLLEIAAQFHRGDWDSRMESEGLLEIAGIERAPACL